MSQYPRAGFGIRQRIAIAVAAADGDAPQSGDGAAQLAGDGYRVTAPVEALDTSRAYFSSAAPAYGRDGGL